jgi:hypothetical protein
MKLLLKLIVGWLSARTAGSEERYLAQSVDAYDFEVRVQALERARI